MTPQAEAASAMGYTSAAAVHKAVAAESLAQLLRHYENTMLQRLGIPPMLMSGGAGAVSTTSMTLGVHEATALGITEAQICSRDPYTRTVEVNADAVLRQLVQQYRKEMQTVPAEAQRMLMLQGQFVPAALAAAAVQKQPPAPPPVNPMAERLTTRPRKINTKLMED